MKEWAVSFYCSVCPNAKGRVYVAKTLRLVWDEEHMCKMHFFGGGPVWE